MIAICNRNNLKTYFKYQREVIICPIQCALFLSAVNFTLHCHGYRVFTGRWCQCGSWN